MRLIVLATALAAAGCGGGEARVKGTLSENGQPPGFLAGGGPSAVVLRPVGPDGKPDPGRLYSMLVARDGSFELVAAGGSVPPGNYQVTLDASGPGAAKHKGFEIKRDLKPGPNELTIDVGKPGG